jgi:DNA-directed RNA polymerase subunit RPC12/RpoP
MSINTLHLLQCLQCGADFHRQVETILRGVRLQCPACLRKRLADPLIAARLADAAPELFEALTQLLEACGSLQVHYPLHEQYATARKLIERIVMEMDA